MFKRSAEAPTFPFDPISNHRNDWHTVRGVRVIGRWRHEKGSEAVQFFILTACSMCGSNAHVRFLCADILPLRHRSKLSNQLRMSSNQARCATCSCVCVCVCVCVRVCVCACVGGCVSDSWTGCFTLVAIVFCGWSLSFRCSLQASVFLVHVRFVVAFCAAFLSCF